MSPSWKGFSQTRQKKDGIVRRRLSSSALLLLLSQIAWGSNQSEQIQFGGSERTLFTHEDPNSGLKELRSAVTDGKLVSCQLFVETTVGKVETIYGGNCVLEKRARKTTVQVCTDTGVGEAGIRTVDQAAATKRSLLEFMQQHCPGG
jgi:hypothetical protein